MKKYKLGMEIGAGDRYSSELISAYNDFEQIKLIEPNSILYHDLASAPNPHENISVGNFAIDSTYGVSEMYCFGYCSFLSHANSFLKLSCEEDAAEYWKSLKTLVNAKRMRQVDSGEIDYLVLTCQGSEMFVLDDMISRPEIIETKYYCHNAKHWEYYNQISVWMAKNGYVGNLLDKSQYDTYFHIEYRKK